MNSVKKQSRYRNPIKTPNLHLIKKKAGKSGLSCWVSGINSPASWHQELLKFWHSMHLLLPCFSNEYAPETR